MTITSSSTARRTRVALVVAAGALALTAGLGACGPAGSTDSAGDALLPAPLHASAPAAEARQIVPVSPAGEAADHSDTDPSTPAETPVPTADTPTPADPPGIDTSTIAKTAGGATGDGPATDGECEGYAIQIDALDDLAVTGDVTASNAAIDAANSVEDAGLSRGCFFSYS